MPWKRELYPDDWEEIAREVKEKYGNKCLRCGSPSVKGRILTVHHLDKKPMNCALWNIFPLCQVCHLHLESKSPMTILEFFTLLNTHFYAKQGKLFKEES